MGQGRRRHYGRVLFRSDVAPQRWVTLAMVKIIEVVLGVPVFIVLPALVLIAVVYSIARGGFWGPIRRIVQPETKDKLGPDLVGWIFGLVFVYGLTLGTGKLLLAVWAQASLGIGVSLIAGVAVAVLLRRGREQ